MSVEPIGDRDLIDALRVQLHATVIGTDPGFMMYGDHIPTSDEMAAELTAKIAEYEGELAAGLPLGHHEKARWSAARKAELHRRRWGRRLQRIVERPVTALVDLVNRLGGDMYFEDY